MPNKLLSKVFSPKFLTQSSIAVIMAISATTAPLAIAKTPQGHVAESLGEINIANGFADLVEAVKPAVVNISVTGSVKVQQGPNFKGQPPEVEEFFKRFFGDQFQNQQRPTERRTSAVGSGFIIDPSGLVVTNNHVIEDADEIEVVFDDGRRIPAELKGTDSKSDLALLQLKTEGPYPFVKFGNSDESRVGDWVVAIGNPFGLGGTTTKGIISARGRDIRSGPLDDFIQVDAPINRGNSGGPLFNMKGEVIGVNSAIYSPNGGSVGIGFAIPSTLANVVITQLTETGTVQRGFLGVQIQVVSDEIAEGLGLDKPKGALVTQVVKDSPAEKAGIEAGDIILKFDGKSIDTMRDLPKIVALTATNKEVDVVVWRNQKEKTLKASVGGNADNPTAAVETGKSPVGKLGITLEALTDENRQQYGITEGSEGVVIADVKADSPAAQKGLQKGDLIKKVGTESVTTSDQVIAAVNAATDEKRETILLLVERDARVNYVVVPLDSE